MIWWPSGIRDASIVAGTGSTGQAWAGDPSRGHRRRTARPTIPERRVWGDRVLEATTRVVTVEAAGGTVAVVADLAADPHPARARTLPDNNATLLRCSWV